MKIDYTTDADLGATLLGLARQGWRVEIEWVGLRQCVARAERGYGKKIERVSREWTSEAGAITLLGQGIALRAARGQEAMAAAARGEA